MTPRAPQHRRTAFARTASMTLLAAGCTLPLPLAGCSSSGASGIASIRSLGPAPLVLEQAFESGCYAELPSETSFWFSSVPLDMLAGAPLDAAVFLHAQMMWEPEPGRTPLASTATNTVTRIVVVSGKEMGLYGGACFARPLDEIGEDSVAISLRGGTLTLLAKTDGFRDLLSPVGLEGTLVARRSPDEAASWRRAVSQYVTNALGRSMWVLDAPRDLPADHGALVLLDPSESSVGPLLPTAR